MKRAALYLRVSTRDQTLDNQRLELQRVALARGWSIDVVYADDGVSGAKGRDKRPGFDQLLKDSVRARFDVVMAWDVSRLGRSLAGLIHALEDLHSNSVDLYLHQQAIDTTTPSGKALFQMCGVFAEFERSMISERVRSGLARARADGKRLGRPRLEVDLEALRRDKLLGHSIRVIAAKHGISVGKVQSLLSEPSRRDA